MKILAVFLVCSLILGSEKLKAQAPDWGWAVQSNTTVTGSEYKFAVPGQMSHDAQGNVYILGGANRKLSIDGNSLKVDGNSFGSLFIVKYDPDGKALWVRQIFDSSQQSLPTGGDGSDFLNNTCIIAMDSVGHSYVCGTAVKNVDLGNNHKLGIGPYIVSYDADGNVLWAKNVGKMVGTNSLGFVRFSGIAADKFGSIYITGSFYDSLSFENTLLVAPGYSSIFIAKFSNTGNILWAKEAGSSMNGGLDAGYGISVQSSGENSNVFIMGYIGSDSIFFDDKLVLNKSKTNQIFLAKYSGQGVIQWVRSSNDQPGISCRGGASGICSDAEANVYLCGNFQADSGFFGDSHIHAIEGRNGYNQYHVFLVKFNGAGETQWVKQVTSHNDDVLSKVFASSIVIDDKNNIYLSGANNGRTNFNGIEGSISNPKGITNLFILQCDSSGKSNWLQSSGAESTGGGINKYTYVPEIFCNGHLYVCGAYRYSMIFGSTHLVANDPVHHTLYLAKLGNTPSSVKHPSTSNQNVISIFPNPAASQATISYTLAKPGNVSLEIFDLLGRQVKQVSYQKMEAGEHSDMLDLHELVNGTYVCRMSIEGRVTSGLFTIVK